MISDPNLSPRFSLFVLTHSHLSQSLRKPKKGVRNLVVLNGGQIGIVGEGMGMVGKWT